MRIPDGLVWLRRRPDGAAWLDALPGVIDEVAQRWDLIVGDAYLGSSVSWVAPAQRGGEPVVLKVQWPHPECEHEAAALRSWASDGAVTLVDHDPVRHALLLERCEPGTRLAQRPEIDAVEVMAGLLLHLWVPATQPFRSLAQEAATWHRSLQTDWEHAGRPCERRLIDAASAWLRELPPSQGEQVLLRQDLHGDNVLASSRAPWLAIDPKPLTGERELSVAPIVRDFQLGHTAGHVTRRLDRLTGELGLDRDRALGWTVAQTMAWAFSSAYAERHVQTVRWLLDARRP